MRLFAPPDVVKGAEAVLRSEYCGDFVLKPGIRSSGGWRKRRCPRAWIPTSASVIQLDLPLRT